MEILWKILFSVALIAVPVLAGFLCDLIHKLAVEAAVNAENEKTQELIHEIDEAVRAAVGYVNQTFVDALKKEGTWGGDDGKKAFQSAFQTVVETISDEASDYILKTFQDIHSYLAVKIEDEVRIQKLFH